MRNTRQAVMHATNQKIVEFQQQVDQYAGHLQQALPAHVSLDRFKRVLITAASTNPDLLFADRRTLMISAIRCASDGLMPDGRQAALVVYNTEIKRRDPETKLDHKFRIDAVQYMPMLAGIRERMRNSGEVVSAEAHCVYANDPVFDEGKGDDPHITHVPAPITQDRGEIVGAYAIIRLKNGEVLRDVMRKSEIEQTRSMSRAPNSPMWTKFYGEACRKTVLRRCSKAAPQTADLDRLIGHDNDDEPASLPALAELSDIPAPEPPRPEQRAIEHNNHGPAYELVDLEGQIYTFRDEATAAAALGKLYAEAAKRGSAFLDGAIESNSATHSQLEDLGVRIEMPQAEPAEPRTEAKADLASRPAQTAEEPHSAASDADAGPPFPGDLPSGAISVLNGDYRAWALGLFLPRVRQMNSSSDLALLLGDNEKNLEDARRKLSAPDLRELESEISARWDEIGEIERATA